MTEPLLLDRFVPTWDHEISLSQVFRAPPAEVFDAITNLDLFRLPVARVLLEARGLPGRLANAAARRHGETVGRTRRRSGYATCRPAAGSRWASGPAPSWSTARSASRGERVARRRSPR